jgi:hypothetical protein
MTGFAKHLEIVFFTEQTSNEFVPGTETMYTGNGLDVIDLNHFLRVVRLASRTSKVLRNTACCCINLLLCLCFI